MSKPDATTERRNAQRRRKGRRTTDKASLEILEYMPDAFAALDCEWRFTYVNGAAERVTRLRRVEMLGRTIWEVFPRFAPKFESESRRAMEVRVPVHFEEYCAPLEKWFECTAYPLDHGLTIYLRDITERKRAEDALRSSEERFRRYFDLGLIGMAITSPTKRCIEVNDKTCEILGYERSELLQRTWSELTHPDDLVADVANFNRVIAGEVDGYSMEKRWIRKDGKVVHTLIAVNCLRREDGSVDHFVALLEDITASKQAEEALRRSHIELERRVAERTTQLSAVNEELRKEILDREGAEQLLRKANEKVEMILESITDRFFAFDNRWRLTYFNKHAEEQLRILGREPEDLIGKVPWEEFETDPEVAEAFRRAMRERVVITHEHYYPPLGEWVENRLYPSPDGGLAVFQRYVTERKRAEEKLRRSEAFLAEGQRLTHTGSWRWNIVTGELFWSEEQFRIYGLDPFGPAPSMSRSFELIHDDDRSFVQQALDDAVRDASDCQWDFRIVCRRDGTIKRVHTTAHPVFDESGVLSEYVGTTMDITERNNAEEALREAQAELAHLTRVMTIGELTVSMAHEVNQPLGAIVTNSHSCLRLLAREDPELSKVREIVQRMIDDGMRASEVIKRLRSLSRRTVPEKELLNINGIIREVISLASSELGKNQVQLHTELEANIPTVLGDRVQLQQVVLNLILNGKEAMSREGWQPRKLLISSRKSKYDEVMVTVRDTGIGLDNGDAERIFDAFFTTKEAGLGLGLSISRTIIEAHGGRLWATPNKSKGTTFQFTLPANS